MKTEKGNLSVNWWISSLVNLWWNRGSSVGQHEIVQELSNNKETINNKRNNKESSNNNDESAKNTEEFIIKNKEQYIYAGFDKQQ